MMLTLLNTKRILAGLALICMGSAASAANWGPYTSDGCSTTAYGKMVYKAILWDVPWGQSWEDAAYKTPNTVEGVYFPTPSRRHNNGLNMWGYWDVTKAECTPQWHTQLKQACHNNKQRYSAILGNIPLFFDWDSACRQTEITLQGQTVKPTQCFNQNSIAEWAIFDVADDICNAKNLVAEAKAAAQANARDYQIRSVINGNVLAPAGNSSSLKTRLVTTLGKDHPAQGWTIQPIASSSDVKLVNRMSGLCAEVDGASLASATSPSTSNLVLNTCLTNAANQRFQLQESAVGYSLKPAHSNLCADVWSGSTINEKVETNVVQYNCSNGLNQKWNFHPLNVGAESLLGVGTDNALYTRQSLYSPWGRVTNSQSVTKATVMTDGSIIGIGMDKLLWARQSLSANWRKVDSNNAMPLLDLDVQEDGTIVAVGTDYQVYTRASRDSIWGTKALNPNNIKITSAATIKNGEIVIGVGLSGRLYTKNGFKLNTGWIELPETQTLKDVTILHDGSILGVGLDNTLYVRKDLSTPWSKVAGSGLVMSVAKLDRNITTPTPPNGNPDCHGASGSNCDGYLLNHHSRAIEAGQTIMVTISTSIGSIAHDNCCRLNPTGTSCQGFQIPTPLDGKICSNEMGRAINDATRPGHSWDVSYKYALPGQSGDLKYRGRTYVDYGQVKPLLESNATYRLRAPAGTRLDSLDEAGFCQSGKAEKRIYNSTNTPVTAIECL